MIRTIQVEVYSPDGSRLLVKKQQSAPAGRSRRGREGMMDTLSQILLDPLRHSRSCSYNVDRDEDCTCALRERLMLETEREESAAWQKRAYESETQLTDAKAEIERLKGELADSEAIREALDNKLDSLAPHGTCACSYDHPNDFCGHHSPQLMAARAEIERLKADHAAAIEREGREVLEMACREGCAMCRQEWRATTHSWACRCIRRAYAEREAERKLPEPDSGEGR